MTSRQIVRLPNHSWSIEVLSENLPRVAAPARLATLDAAEAMAERYQLVTDQTSCVMIYERGEARTDAIPELRKVPQMPAAGWGGLLSLRAMRSV